MHVIPKSSGYLFVSLDLFELLARHRAQMAAEVEQLDGNRLLNTAPPDLVRYLVDKYRLEVPALRRAEWTLEENEVQVDVSQDPLRWINDRSRPLYVPGQQFVVEVPFSGESELLYARASTYTSSAPRATVRENVVALTFTVTSSGARDIRPEIDRLLDQIEQHLGWVRNDVDAFNSALPKEAESAVVGRRERLLSNQGRAAALGIPLKARPNAPKTYAVPTVRRKAVPTLPPAASGTWVPEPTLDDETYEHILSVLQNMTHVMERSPTAFASMGEEALRQHFLVQLNGQFEGRATGETFNVGGKTDILLREKDRNVFIAECKFWKGPKQFYETIDQLLGYAAWRDTKTAILVFVRDTALTTVLSGIDEQARSHRNFKRAVSWRHESGFRFVFHHNGDPNHEFVLTVLAFDIPAK